MRLERQPGFTTGIRCDICGDAHENNFVYYSLDIREVVVQSNKLTTNVASLPIIFSLDSCQKCVNQIGDLVKIHYKATAAGVNCDLCAVAMRGDFTFYYINIAKIVVDIANGRIKCGACGALAGSPGKPCACGNTKVVKVADVVVSDNILQLTICPNDYSKFVDGAARLRQT